MTVSFVAYAVFIQREELRAVKIELKENKSILKEQSENNKIEEIFNRTFSMLQQWRNIEEVDPKSYFKERYRFLNQLIYLKSIHPKAKEFIDFSLISNVINSTFRHDLESEKYKLSNEKSAIRVQIKEFKERDKVESKKQMRTIEDIRELDSVGYISELESNIHDLTREIERMEGLIGYIQFGKMCHTFYKSRYL